MKIVIMIDKSAGNESVGQMWTETFIFDETATLRDVLNICPFDHSGQIQNTVRLQLAKESTNE